MQPLSQWESNHFYQLLCSTSLFMFFNYSFCVCFPVLCVLISILCFLFFIFFVYCFSHVYSWVILFVYNFTYVPRPPGGNPIAFNKYHIVFWVCVYILVLVEWNAKRMRHIVAQICLLTYAFKSCESQFLLRWMQAERGSNYEPEEVH